MTRLRRVDHGFTWTRALIELLIVAAGVLLALALDQWIDGRKDRAEERLLLTAVRAELQSVIKDMDSEMTFRRAMMDNANQIYALVSTDKAPDPGEFDTMVGKLLWWSSVDFTIGATNSILVGGKLRLIRNENIRFFLASLPDKLAGTKQVEANDYWTLMNMTAPYLMKNADLSQIVMTMNERPGGPDTEEPAMHYRPLTPRDHTRLLRDTEFMAVTTAVATSQINVMGAYEELRPQLEQCIQMLDAELQ